MKIAIVGMGWVGSSVAISVLASGIASELLVCDVKRQLAEGEAMDLAHGVAFYPTARVRAASLDELESADAVVVAAGRGGTAAESRLDLLRDNTAIVRDIASELGRLRGLLVVVTNPVDVMTYVAQRASGLPPARVVGTGTMLDTARLRQVLGRELELEPRSVHAQIIGEHGDSEVVLWSGVRIGGVALRHWPGWTTAREGVLANEVRTAAQEIIRRKGATNHAIGLVTAALLRWSLRGERRVLTVSRVQEGVLGVHGVALSLPSIVGVAGATHVLEPDMEAAEREALERSVEALRAAQDSVTKA
ncbi:MAG: lactate/malate family dehydrogenase [Myxococcota bacterium]